MDVAAVVCGDRQEEAMTMVKSILIFTNRQLHFHIVAEDQLQDGIRKQFENFPSSVKKNFQFTIYNLSYPSGEDVKMWKKLFKPCASQRLFLTVSLLLRSLSKQDAALSLSYRSRKVKVR